MAETYSAGIVTAYGAAVRGGYTGTYEQFCAEQAQFGANAAKVAQDRAAVEAATETFTTETVPGAVQTVQQTGATQVQAVEAASDTEQQQIALTGAAQETRVTQAGDDQVDAVEEAGATQVGNVNTAGTTQVGNVNTAGTTQVGAVNTAGATQVQAVEDKGQEVIDSIPDDYTELTEDVSSLKSVLEYGTITKDDTVPAEYVVDDRYIQGSGKIVAAGSDSFKVAWYPVSAGNTYNVRGTGSTGGTGQTLVGFDDEYNSTANHTIDTVLQLSTDTPTQYDIDFAPTVDGYIVMPKIDRNQLVVKLTSEQDSKRIYDLEQTVSGDHDFVEEAKIIVSWVDASDYFRSLFVLHKTHDGSGGYSVNAARNAIMDIQRFDSDISISTNDNVKIAYQLFDGFETGSAHLLYSSGWLDSITIPSGSYWGLIVKQTDEDTTTYQTNNGVSFSVSMSADDLYYKILSNNSSASYVLNSGSIRQRVKTTPIGSILYNQAFCFYDNKYYSTDGVNFGVQDDEFATVETKALSVGHGNNLQLGNEGIAYASGWNDQKIYAVDLSTLEIVETITLPTTGYTTGVVDDLNEIAYIFQRDTHPDTPDNYRFIVYDLQTQTVKSTRVIKSFAAMQSADYYNGKIAVAWGLGVSSAPSGLAIFNTVGDIIAEFNLSLLKYNEPEGVFFDRTTGELYISTSDKTVYKLT